MSRRREVESQRAFHPFEFWCTSDGNIVDFGDIYGTERMCRSKYSNDFTRCWVQTAFSYIWQYIYWEKNIKNYYFEYKFNIEWFWTEFCQYPLSTPLWSVVHVVVNVSFELRRLIVARSGLKNKQSTNTLTTCTHRVTFLQGACHLIFA